jgi:hypothetical protein
MSMTRAVEIMTQAVSPAFISNSFDFQSFVDWNGGTIKKTPPILDRIEDAFVFRPSLQAAPCGTI